MESVPAPSPSLTPAPASVAAAPAAAGPLAVPAHTPKKRVFRVGGSVSVIPAVQKLSAIGILRPEEGSGASTASSASSGSFYGPKKSGPFSAPPGILPFRRSSESSGVSLDRDSVSSTSSSTATDSMSAPAGIVPSWAKDILENLDESSAGVRAGERRTGVIDNIKKSYGFVKDDRSSLRVFFHFSELVPSAPPAVSSPESSPDAAGPASLAPAADAAPAAQPKVGDRVAFTVDKDPESGRMKAVQISILEKDAVPEAVARRSHQRSKTVSALKHVVGGEALLAELLVTKGDCLMTDTELNVGLAVPDAPKETGVIVSCKESFGFIKCAHRAHKQVFFHFSEIEGAAEHPEIIIPGAEVEFTLTKNLKGKTVATAIKILQQGSVKFSEVRPDVFRGRVLKELLHDESDGTASASRSRSGSAATDIPPALPSVLGIPLNVDERPRKRSRASKRMVGIILLESASGDESVKTIKFLGSDVKARSDGWIPRLIEGDVVEFKIREELRTGVEYCTEVSLVSPCKENREKGLVTVMKEGGFGFIAAEGRLQSVHFRLEELLPEADSKQPELLLGSEVEFNVFPDARGLPSAERITILPTGTVNLSKVRIEGVATSSKVVSFMLSGRAVEVPVEDNSVREGDAVVFAVQDGVAKAVKIQPKQAFVATIEEAKEKDQVIVTVKVPKHRVRGVVSKEETLSVTTTKDPLMKVGGELVVDQIEFKEGLAHRSAAKVELGKRKLSRL